MSAARASIAVIAVSLLGGCVSAPELPADYCGFQCSLDRRNAAMDAYVKNGPALNTHQSQEYRDAMAETRRINDEWVQGNRSERISDTGPILTAYGVPGKSGYPAVARCKIDVGFAIPATELDKRTRFDKACYNLLPPQHRESIYQADQRVPGSGATIVIIID